MAPLPHFGGQGQGYFTYCPDCFVLNIRCNCNTVHIVDTIRNLDDVKKKRKSYLRTKKLERIIN